MTLLLVLAVFCLAGAAFLIGELVTAPARQRYVSVRRAATWGKMELPSGTPQEGLQERLVAPIGEVLAKWALKLNPRSSTDNVSRRLSAAGLGLKLSPTGFLALKALLALAGALVGSLPRSGRGPACRARAGSSVRARRSPRRPGRAGPRRRLGRSEDTPAAAARHRP